MPRCLALPIALTCVLLVGCNFNSNTTPAPTRVPTTVALNQTPNPVPFIMTIPPTPTPVCPGAPRTRLIVQERGRVMRADPRPVNLRSAPGLDNRSVDLIPVDAIFYVLDGPVCEGDFAWFKVRYDDQEGWIAEGESDFYYVEPYLVG